MSEKEPGLTKQQQDLVNRIFSLVERVIRAYEFDVATRRMMVPPNRAHVSPADVQSRAPEVVTSP